LPGHRRRRHASKRHDEPEKSFYVRHTANADPVEPHDVVPEKLDVALGIDRIANTTHPSPGASLLVANLLLRDPLDASLRQWRVDSPVVSPTRLHAAQRQQR